jgi:hypothetical protein
VDAGLQHGIVAFWGLTGNNRGEKQWMKVQSISRYLVNQYELAYKLVRMRQIDDLMELLPRAFQFLGSLSYAAQDRIGNRFGFQTAFADLEETGNLIMHNGGKVYSRTFYHVLPEDHVWFEWFSAYLEKMDEVLKVIIDAVSA